MASGYIFVYYNAMRRMAQCGSAVAILATAFSIIALPPVYAGRAVDATVSYAAKPGDTLYDVPTQFRFILSRNEDLRDPLVDAGPQQAKFRRNGLAAGVHNWTIVAGFENGRFYETAAGVRSFALAY
jgi:hypothetical protein